MGQGVAERAGCLSAAGLVVILTVALTIYGAAAFQVDQVPMGVKTLSGRELQKDPLQVCLWVLPHVHLPCSMTWRASGIEAYCCTPGNLSQPRSICYPATSKSTSPCYLYQSRQAVLV